jgi:hypothetical protein
MQERRHKWHAMDPLEAERHEYWTTHANCIDHTASQLFYGISVAENLLIYGADIGNAFAEAPPPKQGFYILPDKAFMKESNNYMKQILLLRVSSA